MAERLRQVLDCLGENITSFVRLELLSLIYGKACLGNSTVAHEGREWRRNILFVTGVTSIVEAFVFEAIPFFDMHCLQKSAGLVAVHVPTETGENFVIISNLVKVLWRHVREA